jgi:hypothetical protein
MREQVMWRGFAIVASALVLGSSCASAQGLRERAFGPRIPGFSQEDAGAFLDARIAALHSGLRLAPDQERMWPAFEQAYRDLANLRQEPGAGAAAGAGAPPADDPIASMRRRADLLTKEGAAYRSLADAATPLWQSFDEGQKRRFALLARLTSPRFVFRIRPGGP